MINTTLVMWVNSRCVRFYTDDDATFVSTQRTTSVAAAAESEREIRNRFVYYGGVVAVATATLTTVVVQRVSLHWGCSGGGGVELKVEGGWIGWSPVAGKVIALRGQRIFPEVKFDCKVLLVK